LITDVVLTEAVWMLKVKRYSLSKEHIIDVIYAFFAESNIKLKDNYAVCSALKVLHVR
jgi:predicted nucleic-acid-binding protein